MIRNDTTAKPVLLLHTRTRMRTAGDSVEYYSDSVYYAESSPVENDRSQRNGQITGQQQRVRLLEVSVR